MARGRWTRWGRGGCEGYSLDLGSLINFSVVRQSSSPAPDHFVVTSHTRKIATFPTAKDAMATIEKNLEWDMQSVLEDWDTYKAEKAKRRKS